MERQSDCDGSWDRVFGSFTTAVGFALGELLLLAGRPEELLEHLRSIDITARATLMSSDTHARDGTIRREGVSLSVAALGVVRAWHAEPHDQKATGEAVALLEEVLEEIGVLRVLSQPNKEE